MKRLYSYLLSVALVISMFGPISTCKHAYASARLVVSFIDIGQGNATLLRYKGKNYLIDTGEESEYSKLKAFLDERNVTTIENMIISHDDSDHMGSADLVIRDYRVKCVTRAKHRTNKDTYDVKELKRAIKRNNIKVYNVEAGSTVSMGDNIRAKVLSPSVLYEETNQQSIVLRVDYNEDSFLFTGDIDAKVEGEVRLSNDVDVDVLQIAHHGSAYSSSMMWLNDTSPEYAVISVGADNSYGHPDSTILKRIKHFASKTYRTDRDGSVIFTSTGNGIHVRKTGGRGVSSGSTSSGSKVSENSSSSSNTVSSSSKTNRRVIGNVNSGIYHNSSCHCLPAKYNRVYFKNAKQAKKAGYRACKICGG